VSHYVCTNEGIKTLVCSRSREEDEEVKPKRTWNHPKKIRQKTPEEKPCPQTLVGVKRDNIYNILHPHTLY